MVSTAALGDPARLNMLAALMDGRALTAGELAGIAGVAPTTASGHLARLLEAGLLAMERQGRHRYHRLASPEVARVLEGLMALSAERSRTPPRALRTGPRDMALREARTCYDHLAGRLAVGMADAMVVRGHLDLSPDGGALTEAGASFLERLGVVLPVARGRPFCRPCLDWSERRSHLAGALGAALCRRCLDLGWMRRVPNSRALSVTPAGWRGLRESFGLDQPLTKSAAR
ncbi:ArsR/SmtB family transcription factor [Roseomonas xinghualingensis]|uniref:ArsR/SmtB family transcription factor n=1 Tax=Roseomonas xinghualingensis TaxID=2986475 RepID=UPI0021F1E1A8|nr:winged helix-turn-helix domain-containing protein [Roseomonas sp. SXEYE001]MCV4209084.1 winged helix-turn-helix domain-containing protein [Roseomonas sp. SXEYE001]